MNMSFSCPPSFLRLLRVPCFPSGPLPSFQAFHRGEWAPGPAVPHSLGGAADQVPAHPWSRLAHGPSRASLMLSSKDLKIKQLTQRLKTAAADAYHWRCSEEPANLAVHPHA